ncbi:MAG: 50S ribosomal protein L6 [Rickettsiales bacterium]|nr:50S ribosomal protein L6 [Rickettsiales bacterium]
MTSRIGKLPIKIPNDLGVSVSETIVTLKKKDRVKTYDFGDRVDVVFENNQLVVREKENMAGSVVFSGLHRSNLNNIVRGLTDGFKVVLEYNGVGYRAVVIKDMLVLGLGYSHDIFVKIPVGLTVTPEKPNLVIVQGDDREAVGNFASRIISLRTTEPYKGKGIKYKDREILRKEGKKK